MKRLSHIPLSVLWRSWHVHKGALQCHYVLLPVQWTELCFHPVNTQAHIHYGRFCCLLYSYRWKAHTIHIKLYTLLWFPDIFNGSPSTKRYLCFRNIIWETKLESFNFPAWSHQAHRSNDSHTLSVRVASQSGCASSSLTMSAWPCSLAHISAVEPSSSWRLTSAPCARSACTMSILPWLTASIRAVWPAWAAESRGQTNVILQFCLWNQTNHFFHFFTHWRYAHTVREKYSNYFTVLYFGPNCR